jgi:hypothetical protein
MSGFWLAMIFHHRGEHDQAANAYQRAVRCWKEATTISRDRDVFVDSVWKEAKSLLASSR